MKIFPSPPKHVSAALSALLLLMHGNGSLRADDALVPLKLKLPDPVFAGTPKDAPRDVEMEPMPTNAPTLMVPADAQNIAPGKKLSSSDKSVSPAALARITDGNKAASDDSVVFLRKGLQWLQFDLGKPQEIFAIALWHAHDTAKVYRSVIIQASDNADFTDNVRTLYNNDRGNSAGLGAGTNRQYFETYIGKTLEVKTPPARYLRFYSHGSTDSAINEYTEIEIYGRPAK